MRILISLFILFASLSANGQFPKTYTSSEIFHDLLKANRFGNILYVAAHPDDENTRLIAYFENNLKARTAYLSLTRGDGGQNLIGTETGAATGVLRTQELLGARAIDGGEQFFSRAVDFGYSKSSVETLEKWGKDALLHDMVWVIRKFQPDVLITRFPPSNSAGHGHHEASALLAEEAFDLAGNPDAFPKQLVFVQPWKVKRLYFNASSWWIENIAEKAKNSDDFILINVGEYNSLLGESYAQMAARSRSEHKSQGFGSDFSYGLNIEYLEFVKGEKANRDAGIFDGVETGWARINSPKVGKMMEEIISGFNHSAPQASVPALISVLQNLRKLPASSLRESKITELEVLVIKMAGIKAEALASEKCYTPGEKTNFRVNIIQNTDDVLMLKAITSRETNLKAHTELKKNELFSEEFGLTFNTNEPLSNPYWLNKPYEGLYDVTDYNLLSTPQNKPSVELEIAIELYGYSLTMVAPLMYKIVDPVKAVRYWPVRVIPKVTFNFSESSVVMTGNTTKSISVLAQNNNESTEGSIRLQLPLGWKSTPESVQFKSSKRGEVQRIEFLIESAGKAQDGNVEILFVSTNSQPFSAMGLQEIEYDHIPAQIIITPATIPIRNIQLAMGGVKRVGYIEGPGDDVAKYLQAAGYFVEVLTPEMVQKGDLGRYDAILTGIRAFNTRPELSYLNKLLNEYVAQGGTWIVQYNTSRGIKSDTIGPYSFEIGRERVTDEYSTAHFINPGHPVLNVPNKLSAKDFEGWVQERGLYFAGTKDPKFESIISWNDPGEPPRDGALIVAPYENGYFVYTGISFFRQLPAGVPGAYRLLANIMNLSHSASSGNE